MTHPAENDVPEVDPDAFGAAGYLLRPPAENDAGVGAGVKPYYQDELVTLYHGDCRDVLPLLGTFDAAIVDPPYGETSLKWDRWIPELPGLLAAHTSSMWCFGSLRMFLDHVVDFGGWKLSQDVVWEKHNGSGFHADRFKRVHEIAVHWYRGDWTDLYHEVPKTMDATRRAVRRKERPAHTGVIADSTYVSEDGGPRLMRSVIYARLRSGPRTSRRGFFRFAHIDGTIPADPAVYARLPKVNSDETRTQGLDRLELIRFLQVAQTITVHHGALAYLLGINALRASEAAAVEIPDYAETLRGHRVLHLIGKGNKPATMPITVPVLRVLEACRGERTSGPLILRPLSGKPIDRRDVYRMVARIAKAAGIPRHISPHSLRHAAITNALDAGVPLRDAQILARHADPRTTEHYDRARGNLDRHGVHFLTAYVAGV